ncbi:hypothetical protein J2T13_004445 [Paenibacillus sp. DS2015]|uniref:DUF2487 family protein n=1 Tax=Paenibacillus sp. DS2015 TaxID=3373917 RepID=UPI003D212991
MKFSEIDENSWPELQPYFDTCLIPFTGLSGLESPIEATAALERLRDFLDLVEQRYKGRMVTYPAFHYADQGTYKCLNELCHSLIRNGFKYVIIMTVDVAMKQINLNENALVLSRIDIENFESHTDKSVSDRVQTEIENLWKNKGEKQM